MGTKSALLHTFRNHIWKITETWKEQFGRAFAFDALLYIVGIGKKIYIMASFDNVQWFLSLSNI